jgi:hypothetical protein
MLESDRAQEQKREQVFELTFAARFCAKTVHRTVEEEHLPNRQNCSTVGSQKTKQTSD